MKENTIVLNERLNILFKYYYSDGEMVSSIYMDTKKIDDFVIETSGEHIYILFNGNGFAKIEKITPPFLSFILDYERKRNKKVINSNKECDKLDNNKCQDNPIDTYIKKALNENCESIFHPKKLTFDRIELNRKIMKNQEKKCQLYNNNKEKIKSTKNNNHTKELLEIINLLTNIITKLTDDKCILINANNIKLLIGKYNYINNSNLNSSIINHIKECLNDIIYIMNNQKDLSSLMELLKKQIERDKAAFAKEYNMPFDLFAILEGCDYN